MAVPNGGQVDYFAIKAIKGVLEDEIGDGVEGDVPLKVWNALQPFIGHIVREELRKAKKSDG